MICPMISAKRLEPYQCEGAECAWWIGDKKQGECAIKEIAGEADKISSILDWEQISRLLKKINF